MTAVVVALVALVLLNAVILLRVLRIGQDPALLSAMKSLADAQERAERSLRDDLSRTREETLTRSRELREEVGGQIGQMNQAVITQLGAMATAQHQQLTAMRDTVGTSVRQLQEDNSRKLDDMRKTVDEKLQGTLEKRLGESFRLVSDRLEQVHKGLGEMQTLASGVGDLKKVLTNVRVRGTWGEVQLGNLLEQVLHHSQYETNVATRPGSSERVEFAIRLPSKTSDDQVLLLPIDAKFPQEDYARLVDAQQAGDVELMEQCGKQLEVRIRDSARQICDKYIDPPNTTDFGIMFLPTEGLYAEIARRPGLMEVVQRDYRVAIAGPTTLWAILSSFQMGFRTLAIEKRSSEVWATLGEIKTEFGKFGGVLDKVRKKLQEASNAVDQADVRKRAVERTLRSVDALPVAESATLELAPGLILEAEPADTEEI